MPIHRAQGPSRGAQVEVEGPADDAALQPRGLTARRVRLLVLVVGFVVLALAARAALDEADGVERPGILAMAASVGLTCAAIACAAHSWAALVPGASDRRAVRMAFYDSQLVKYLPGGGVAQAAGQVGMTVMQGAPMAEAAVALLVFVVALVAAGLTVGAGLILVDTLHPVVRALSLLGLLAPLVMRRDALTRLVRAGRRVTRRVPEPERLVGSRSLWSAFAWSVANLVLYAGGYLVLLGSLTHLGDPVVAGVAFVVAWTAGFLALPLPSGLGVRELVLVGLLPGVGAGPLLAASLGQRLAAIAAEIITVGGVRMLGAISRSWRGRPDEDGHDSGPQATVEDRHEAHHPDPMP